MFIFLNDFNKKFRSVKRNTVNEKLNVDLIFFFFKFFFLLSTKISAIRYLNMDTFYTLQ